jgi:5'-methylthioadenosine phosphorylase
LALQHEVRPNHLQPAAELAERVLLPGDPGRALAVAQALLETPPKMFNHARGLWGYTGIASDGEPLSVQATGIGGPSAAIVCEELIALGATRLVRIGTCGALDPELELGTLIVFDDLHFLANRLPDGSLCTLHTEPGTPGRGHWIFDGPFSEPLRAALLEAAREVEHPARDGGCYGHVDGPRFNTRTEIRMLASAGVTAVSQTAGPETVLSGEAEIPYALLGYATDYANGVKPEEPTPVEELVRLVGESTGAFARVLAAAVPRIAQSDAEPVGTHFRFD